MLVDLRTRPANSFGRGGPELAEVVADLAGVEPFLLRTADLVLTTNAARSAIADLLLARIAEIDPSLP